MNHVWTDDDTRPEPPRARQPRRKVCDWGRMGTLPPPDANPLRHLPLTLRREEQSRTGRLLDDTAHERLWAAVVVGIGFILTLLILAHSWAGGMAWQGWGR